MAIKLYIPVTVEIEDKSFKIEVKDPTPADTEEIQKFSHEAETSRKALAKTYVELSEIEETMKINYGLLETQDGLIYKGKLWLEQRDLLKEKKRLEEVLKELPDVMDYSEAFKKRFELLVIGEGKEDLEKEMKKHNISYERVIQEIDNIVKKEKKKK